MKFVVLNQGKEMRSLATFYETPDFKGDEQSFPMGRYSLEQFRIGKAASVKLKENAVLLAYENSDKTGKFAVLHGEVPDLDAVLTFKPSILSITRCVSGFKDGKLTDYLIPGVYDSNVLQRFDEFEIPEDAKMVFWSGESDEPDEGHTSSYEAGRVEIDENMEKFDKFAIVLVGNKELADQAEEASKLSDDILQAVAGGCMAVMCGAQICGADICPAQTCPAQVCGLNVFPFLPIGP
jgi:hypothetical protein